MNGNPISTDNQYTLEWTKNGVPELVQHSNQDNHGVGLQVGKGERAKETAAPDKQETEIWFNRSLGTKPQTLDEMKKGVMEECKDSRPLSKTEQKKLNECKSVEEMIKYLSSIGVKVSFAV